MTPKSQWYLPLPLVSSLSGSLIGSVPSCITNAVMMISYLGFWSKGRLPPPPPAPALIPRQGPWLNVHKEGHFIQCNPYPCLVTGPSSPARSAASGPCFGGLLFPGEGRCPKHSTGQSRELLSRVSLSALTCVSPGSGRTGVSRSVGYPRS